MQNELIDGAWRKELKTTATVRATWMENAGGGLGALGLAGTLAYWSSGGNWSTVAAWGVTLGILTFSGLMLARSAIDEIVDWSDYRAMLADIDALEDANDLLEKRCAALQRDLRAAETYGAYRASRPGVMVQDRNGEPMPAAAPTPIRNDAKNLIQLHFETGKWPAKDSTCPRLGWTTSRWEDARDELQRHGIITTRGRQTIVLAETLATALATLAGDVER